MSTDQHRFVDDPTFADQMERLHALEAGKLKLRPMERPIYEPALPSGGQR